MLGFITEMSFANRDIESSPVCPATTEGVLLTKPGFQDRPSVLRNDEKASITLAKALRQL